jgi:hypothetical protein
MKGFSVRNHSIGKERRLNLTKQTLDKTIHFPKSVSYEDIDNCVFEWLDKELYFEYDGVKYPTYKLFSNQRVGQYSQTWEKYDEKGNLEVNFKTLTREPNPQKGDNQGNNMNIPGYRDYPVFENIVTDENGESHKEIYCMKQPSSIDLLYTISIITSSYRALNEFNELVQLQFNSIQKYIFPNGFAMPLTLEAVSDESETQLDDRKYYAQTYQIKCHAFIIREKDYTIKLVPMREKLIILGGRNRSKKKKPIVEFMNRDSGYETTVNTLTNKECIDSTALKIEKVEVPFDERYNPISGHSESIEYEIEGLPICEESNEMYPDNNRMEFKFSIDPCNPIYEYTFSGGSENFLWVFESISTDNIDNFTLELNGEELNYEENSIEFNDGDVLVIHAIMQNPFRSGEVSIICVESD